MLLCVQLCLLLIQLFERFLKHGCQSGIGVDLGLYLRPGAVNLLLAVRDLLVKFGFLGGVLGGAFVQFLPGGGELFFSLLELCFSLFPRRGELCLGVVQLLAGSGELFFCCGFAVSKIPLCFVELFARLAELPLLGGFPVGELLPGVVQFLGGFRLDFVQALVGPGFGKRFKLLGFFVD